MYINGTKIEHNVEINVETDDIFKALKLKLLNKNTDYNIDKVFINDNEELVTRYYYHGSRYEDDNISVDKDIIQTFKEIENLRLKFLKLE